MNQYYKDFGIEGLHFKAVQYTEEDFFITIEDAYFDGYKANIYLMDNSDVIIKKARKFDLYLVCTLDISCKNIVVDFIDNRHQLSPKQEEDYSFFGYFSGLQEAINYSYNICYDNK